MADLARVLIPGITWITIAMGLGVFGSWLTIQPGFRSILGWPIAIISFGFAGISALRLWRIARHHQPNKMEYVAGMAEMAAESERTYRGMIDTYNSEVKLGMLSVPPGSAVLPTGRGIYKARLFGALFMVMAYVKSGHSKAENEEMMNVATGVALETLQGPGEPRLDREEAKSFTVAYLTSTFKAMIAAFAAGPLLPGSAAQEHLTLTHHLHEALAESIGTDRYTAEVRERFAVTVQGNTALAMNHAKRWLAGRTPTSTKSNRMS